MLWKNQHRETFIFGCNAVLLLMLCVCCKRKRVDKSSNIIIYLKLKLLSFMYMQSAAVCKIISPSNLNKTRHHFQIFSLSLCFIFCYFFSIRISNADIIMHYGNGGNLLLYFLFLLLFQRFVLFRNDFIFMLSVLFYF